ncbi:RCC1/BLIP-II [Meira miltonrushii]|uniref:RCC1/BLIP-II n=1 Tax=Meira miltonrushii TaxID=1280837 RepID=A0A316VPR0_9BASI|nr:RCC1/BLIP-II [Meira miltonrushii]PWN38141.1 RCC1/BLIP-II [Meira miltonrushii]
MPTKALVPPKAAIAGNKRGRSRTPSIAPTAAAETTNPKTPGKRKASGEIDGIGNGKLNALATPSVAGTPRSAKRTRQDPSLYVIKKGINALPAPILPITKALLKEHLASSVSSPFSNVPQNAEDLSKQPPVLTREMFVFGNGDMGQHGLGTDVLDEIKRPRRHVMLGDLIKEGKLGSQGLETVAAGGMHTLAIDSTGRIFSWGINDNACLGRETSRDPNVETEELETQPLPVEGLSPTGQGILGGEASAGGGTEGAVEHFRATRVAAGDSVSVALSDRGELRVWGSFRSNDGLLGFDGTIGSAKLQYKPVSLPALIKHSFVQVSCGADHVLALSTEGIVFSWGNGQQGQLGRRIIERRKINGLTPERLHLRDIVSIGAAAYHSFAIDKRGEVWAWGLNTLSQLGVGTKDDVLTMPERVPSLSPKNLGGARVIQAHGGQHHSLFLLDDGRVFGCGRCDGLELGIPESHPAMKEVVEARNAWSAQRDEELKSEMVAYEKRMAEKRASQTGPGGGGISGTEMILSEEDMPPRRGPPPDEYVRVPAHIPFPNDAKITSISCGARHNLAVDQSGTVYSWGFGVSSQLGQGDEEQIETPTPVVSKQLKPFSTVFANAGGQHCVLLAVSKGEEEMNGASA